MRPWESLSAAAGGAGDALRKRAMTPGHDLIELPDAVQVLGIVASHGRSGGSDS